MAGDLKYDYLVIGGGIAGVTAAETIREQNLSATIGIISGEPHLLYSRVLIPSYLKRRISREQLFLRRTEDFTLKNIDLHLGQTASAIDPKLRAVKTENGLTLRYKKLLISSGGKVKSWGKEAEQKFIYRMQTLDDADRIISALPKLARPVVIGTSFISLEFLEVFFLNKINPVLLARDAYFFGKMLDKQGGELLDHNFERHGIKSYFGDAAREIKEQDGRLLLLTERLEEIGADALGIGVGIERNTEFLRGSGLNYGEKGIRTNEFLQTNVEEIYAAGDVAEYYDTILGIHHVTGNWTNGFLQGKRAGLNLAGAWEPYKNVQAYSITNLGFQITALGEMDANSETIVRLDPRHDQYERLFIRDGILRGAALINRFQDKPHLTKLIETKTSIAKYLVQLQSLEFDIRGLPVIG
jgi:NAD(P)H-nitrite reductase large subunit